jgi:flagellar biosynthesis protein FlhF
LESAILDVVLPELLSSELKRYYFGLRENEVETDLALEICRTLQKANSYTSEDLANILNTIISKRGTFPAKEKNIVFVGPCGSGKSSLLAKFATEFVFNRKEAVSLTTLDKFRPGAEQEIDNLTEILEIVEESREEKKPKTKHQLIDTTGLVINDEESLAEMSEELRSIPDRYVILVLSASTSWKTNRRFLAQFLPLGIHAIALTQLDLSSSCGTILNVAAHDYPPIICMSESRLPTGTLVNFDAKLHLSKLIGEENV